MDMIYLGAIVIFFVVTLGLLKLCERLMEGES